MSSCGSCYSADSGVPTGGGGGGEGNVACLNDIDAALVSDVRGYWQFNGDFTDQSGNGQTLAIKSGTARFTELDCLGCVYLDGNVTVGRAVNDAPLTITGALTAHLLALFMQVDSVGQGDLYRFNGVDETEPDNQLYALSHNGINLRYFAEFGAGNNIIHDFDVGPPPGNFHLYTMTRSAEAGGQQNLNFYIDGQLYGSVAASVTAVTGGTDAVFDIDDAFAFYGGLLIAATEQSQAEIEAVWNQVAGL